MSERELHQEKSLKATSKLARPTRTVLCGPGTVEQKKKMLFGFLCSLLWLSDL